MLAKRIFDLVLGCRSKDGKLTKPHSLRGERAATARLGRGETVLPGKAGARDNAPPLLLS